MTKPTYEELIAVVKRIAGLIYDGDQIDGEEEHEMSIDDAFETCAICRDLTRDILKTDGSDLPVPQDWLDRFVDDRHLLDGVERS